ncbi:hypothetical protein [Nocardia terpenica]|uniref:Uncharacterized protein n=1 Tax=Nocardia terpenica TaxID=455432 RepID=A0A291RFS4_9NOCA|nr:hypothetical protein [Nocardia terpenica]ATL66217.1 hypothetical protein CRH09_08415 [Nocardia terpenica]
MTDPRQYVQEYGGKLQQAQQDLTRFLTEDGKNVFRTEPGKTIWTPPPSLNSSDVNDLLKQGEPGLEWFRLALVRYHRVHDVLGGELHGFDHIDIPPLPIGDDKLGGERINTADDPRKSEFRRLEETWYYQQRGMNIPSLRETARHITGAALGTDSHAGAADITTDLSTVATVVPEVWQGQGGAAAGDHLAGFHAHADQQAEYLKSVAAALNGLPDVLVDIVRNKAGFVAGFASDQFPVAGHAMRLSGAEDPVSTLISYAAGGSDIIYSHRAVTVVEEQFHVTGAGSKDYRKQIQAQIKDWLYNHFAPAVREACIALVHQCALADYYIRQAYKPVIDLLDNHDQKPFPKPQDQQPAPPQYQPTGSTSPASVQTAGLETSVPQPGTQIPTQAPTSVAPAAVADPLQTLTGMAGQAQQVVSGLAGQAAQTVQQGIGQVESMIQNGLGGLPNTPPTDAAASSDSRPLASFPLGGGNLSLAQTRDGAVTATFTGPDGKPQRYTLGIKNGAPYLTRSEEPPAPASGTATTGHRSASGGTGVGSGSGLPTGRPSPIAQVGTSSEHTPPISVPATASGSPTPSSPATPAQSATASTPSGMPMGGMPPGGGASAGKGAPDGERRSTGIIPPKPLWNTLPGREGPVLDASAIPEPAATENLYTTPTTVPAPVAPHPEPPTAPATPPEPAPPAPRRDGVKIEIDMGDHR